MSGKQPSGIVSVPYLLKATKTSVNGKTVWHSNLFINGNMTPHYKILIQNEYVV